MTPDQEKLIARVEGYATFDRDIRHVDDRLQAIPALIAIIRELERDLREANIEKVAEKVASVNSKWAKLAVAEKRIAELEAELAMAREPSAAAETEIKGIDSQVIVAAAQLSKEQKAQPAWLWFDNLANIHSLGRWNKNPEQAPYIRADMILATLTQRDDEIRSLREGREWQPIETAPKGVKVIGGFLNPSGKWRTVLARYYLLGTLDSSEWEEEDGGYAPEGWYEESESYDELSPITCLTHWRPLPPASKE